jgi:LCP family protein required for cell wall assembly
LSLVFSAGVGAVAFYLPVLAATAAATGHTGDLPVQASPTASQNVNRSPGAPFTVLLLGSDNDEKFPSGAPLTQSMILIRVDPTAKQVTMLSIPRDLWVTWYPGGGAGKIDEIHAHGGPSAAISTVERNFHIHIDDYIWIGLKGLIKVIDLMGGLDLIVSNPVLDDNYPADIDTEDPFGYQRVAVLPGAQHLDGVHALQYVRSRHGDRRGDFARSQRQQQVLLALKAKAGQVGPADLPDLATAMGSELRTSMSPQRVAQLLPFLGGLKPENIRQVVLLGDYTSEVNEPGNYALIPHWSLILPLVHQSFPAA